MTVTKKNSESHDIFWRNCNNLTPPAVIERYSNRDVSITSSDASKVSNEKESPGANDTIVSVHKNDAEKCSETLDTTLVETDQITSQDLKCCQAMKSSSLLRLFNSPLFSPSMAVYYIYSSNEQGVIMYLGNRLFQFTASEILFFLPQLLCITFNSKDVAQAVFAYLIAQSRKNIQHQLKCITIINSFASKYSKSHLKAIILKNKLLTHNIADIGKLNSYDILNSLESEKNKCHRRSKSDMIHIIENVPVETFNINSNNLKTRNKYNIGVECCCKIKDVRKQSISTLFSTKKQSCRNCICPEVTIRPQIRFLNALIEIGSYLQTIEKENKRSTHLINQLVEINKSLPARVWVPFDDVTPHHIVNIPPLFATLLKSADNAPYLLYIEIVECDSIVKSPLPITRKQNTLRMTHSVDNVNLMSDLNSICTSSSENTNENPLHGRINSGTKHISMENGQFSKSSVTLDSWSLKSLDSLLIAENFSKLEKDIYNSTSISFANSFSPKSIRANLEKSIVNSTGNVKSENNFYMYSVAEIHEGWSRKVKQLKYESPYSSLPGWNVMSLIVKYGDELQQELMAYQFMVRLQKIWDAENIELRLSPCKVCVITEEAGFIQPATNVLSLHELRKHIDSDESLLSYFYWKFGNQQSERFIDARNNFIKSCAAYCVLCYLLEVKDRHNGNILLASDGRLIHIDFAYILSLSPGQNIGFELSPFKLTNEFVAVIGGERSANFQLFKTLIVKGLMAVRKHSEELMSVVEPLHIGSNMSCFNSQVDVIAQLRKRFFMFKTEAQLISIVETMVSKSISSFTTRLYDNFQYYSNGIF